HADNHVADVGCLEHSGDWGGVTRNAAKQNCHVRPSKATLVVRVICGRLLESDTMEGFSRLHNVLGLGVGIVELESADVASLVGLGVRWLHLLRETAGVLLNE